jgi:hypothetical protein
LYGSFHDVTAYLDAPTRDVALADLELLFDDRDNPSFVGC